MVGEAIATRLVALGHNVMMGSREAINPKAAAWAARNGRAASAGSFSDTAAFGEALFNCTNGAHAIDALRAGGQKNLSGKVLIDVANVLPPDPAATHSLGERIQVAFAQTKVVKALNTMNCEVMVDPAKVPGVHSVFLCGNDAGAKATASKLLQSFGWKDIIDLGDISNARATEAYLPLWLALWKALGTSVFNINVVRS